MSRLQYIGARYVPVWYENSLNQTADWEPNVEYEPLTWVTSQNNHLYLSKKTVPDNIGTPAQNTAYWLDMGSFNGQFQDLQDQIDDIRDGLAPTFDDANNYSIGDCVWYEGELYIFTTAHTAGSGWDGTEVSGVDITSIIGAINNLDQRVTDIENTLGVTRRYIVISDSYGLVRNNIPWTTTIQNLINAASGNFYTYSEGGMGFVTAGHDSDTALTLLQSHENDIADHDTITDIVFGLGINDLGVAYSSIVSAIDTLVAYCKTTYPGAKLYFGFIGNKFNKTGAEYNSYFDALKAVNDGASKNGALYITNVEYIMHNGKLVQSDNVHPTTDGCNDIANHVYAFLNGSVPDVIYRDSKDDGVFRINARMHNGSISIEFVVYNPTSALSIPNRSAIQISGSWLANTLVRGGAGHYLAIPGSIYITGNVYHPCVFMFGNGGIYIQVPTGTATTWLANSAVMTWNVNIDTLMN